MRKSVNVSCMRQIILKLWLKSSIVLRIRKMEITNEKLCNGMYFKMDTISI